MDSKTFGRVFDEQVHNCADILVSKANEYATNDERLHNFKVAASVTGRNAVQALGGMMVKHTTSVYDMIESGEPTAYSRELWDEKITDHINYLILLKAAVLDAYSELSETQEELPLDDDKI